MEESKKRMINILYNNVDVQTRPGSRVVMKGLSGSLVGELQMGRLRIGTTGFVSVLFTNVPMGHATSEPGFGQQQQQRR